MAECVVGVVNVNYADAFGVFFVVGAVESWSELNGPRVAYLLYGRADFDVVA